MVTGPGGEIKVGRPGSNRGCGLFSSLSKPLFGPPRCAPNDRARLDEQFLGDHPYKRFAKCYIEVELVLRRCGGFALLLHQGRKERRLIDRTSSFLGSLGVHMPSPFSPPAAIAQRRQRFRSQTKDKEPVISGSRNQLMSIG